VRSLAAPSRPTRLPWAPSRKEPSGMARVWHSAQELTPTSNTPFCRTL
jgi:hypothetical protein